MTRICLSPHECHADKQATSGYQDNGWSRVMCDSADESTACTVTRAVPAHLDLLLAAALFEWPCLAATAVWKATAALNAAVKAAVAASIEALAVAAADIA